MGSVLKRAGWIFLAALFIVTGLGVGIVGFWQATHTNNNQSQTQTAQNQAPTCTNDPSIQFNSPIGSEKLAGAKLSDFTPVAHAPALNCTDVKVGSGGQAVSSSSSITANYTGAVASTGVIFQSSLDNNGQPFTSGLSSVIPGWQQGLLGMRAGGERRLLIPSALAYGATGSCQIQDSKNPAKCDVYAINPNTDLVFDITVLAVQ